MVSLIILLLGIFIAGLVVGVFFMTLMEFKQIYGMKNTHPETGKARPLHEAGDAISVDQP
jgi:heme/copper-type cytochrome/quinol oxidase subunit 2